MASNNGKIDFLKLNQQTSEYFYPGYNIFFMHGWFSSYLSAPSDSEEDEVIPCYLILDEDKINNEKVFAKFIDNLMLIFTQMADSIYEKNKLIKPMVNPAQPNNFNAENLSSEEKSNLLIWLYGYLCGYLTIGADITEYCKDNKLLDNTFFPALQSICSLLLLLESEIKAENIFSGEVLQDFKDLLIDIAEMWEADEVGRSLTDLVAEMVLSDSLNGLVKALNAIFYVVRTADEAKLNSQPATTLLNNLSVH